MPVISPASLLHAVSGAPRTTPAASAWVRHYSAPSPRGYGLIAGGMPTSHTGYVSEDDLRKTDAQVQAEAQAVDVAAAQCGDKLPAADKVLWAQTYARWQGVHTQAAAALASFNPLGIGYGDLSTELKSCEQDILRMQARVHAACPGAIGDPTPGGSWGKIILYLGIAAAVVAGLWFLSPALLALAGGSSRRG